MNAQESHRSDTTPLAAAIAGVAAAAVIGAAVMAGSITAITAGSATASAAASASGSASVSASASVSGSGSESGSTLEAGYICPPCGHENDGKVYHKAGACPVCGMRLMRSDETRNVAILLFEGVQIIDFTGPYEVFGQVGPFNVYTVSETGESLTTAMGMSVKPSYGFENAPEPDILVVPGGSAHEAYDNPKIVAWVRAKADAAEHVMSVCNGAFILAKAGLLDGLKATTFYGLIDDLREFAPRTEVVTDQRYVDNGKVITSAGLSSGIDASLYLVSKIRGLASAKNLALHLEYDWNPASTFARAALADRKLPNIASPPDAVTTLVATEGSRDRWERTHRVESMMSEAELRRYVIDAVRALEGWSLKDAEALPAGAPVEGTYREPDGTAWAAGISFSPTQGAVLVTMRIERSGPRRATR